MVANLWDVTDKDIDRFLACLLSSWLSDDTTTEPRKLLDVVPKARAACRLPHLIGAAPVVYGFPVFLKPSWLDRSDQSSVATVCCVEDWTFLFLRIRPSSVQQPLDRVLLGYYRNNLLLVLPKNASKLCVKLTVSKLAK